MIARTEPPARTSYELPEINGIYSSRISPPSLIFRKIARRVHAETMRRRDSRIASRAERGTDDAEFSDFDEEDAIEATLRELQAVEPWQPPSASECRQYAHASPQSSSWAAVPSPAEQPYPPPPPLPSVVVCSDGMLDDLSAEPLSPPCEVVCAGAGGSRRTAVTFADAGADDSWCTRFRANQRARKNWSRTASSRAHALCEPSKDSNTHDSDSDQEVGLSTSPARDSPSRGAAGAEAPVVMHGLLARRPRSVLASVALAAFNLGMCVGAIAAQHQPTHLYQADPQQGAGATPSIMPSM